MNKLIDRDASGTTLTTVTARLRSIAPYSQSKHYTVPKEQGESADDHYRRTWRNHCHVDSEGMCFIPPGAFKNCLAETALFLQIPIPGRGKSTYTKHFEAGVLCFRPLPLGVYIDDVQCEELFLPSDGKRGGSKRVVKFYPTFPKWEGDVEFTIIDETVLQTTVQDKKMTVFEHVLRGAGNYVGIGRFRPRKAGFYGRFVVDSVNIQR